MRVRVRVRDRVRVRVRIRIRVRVRVRANLGVICAPRHVLVPLKLRPHTRLGVIGDEVHHTRAQDAVRVVLVIVEREEELGRHRLQLPTLPLDGRLG